MQVGDMTLFIARKLPYLLSVFRTPACHYELSLCYLSLFFPVHSPIWSLPTTPFSPRPASHIPKLFYILHSPGAFSVTDWHRYLSYLWLMMKRTYMHTYPPHFDPTTPAPHFPLTSLLLHRRPAENNACSPPKRPQCW